MVDSGGRSGRAFPREVYRISAAAAPGAPDTLYLAYEVYGYPQTKVMIARVTDRGESMEQYRAEGLVVVKSGISYGVLATLKADPRTPTKLYALVTKDPGNDEIFALFQALWVSVDGGRNWSGSNLLWLKPALTPSTSAAPLDCSRNARERTSSSRESEIPCVDDN